LAKYTIKFAENSQNEIECFFIAKYYIYDDEIRRLKIEKIDAAWVENP
jgi:hypothetical protein